MLKGVAVAAKVSCDAPWCIKACSKLLAGGSAGEKRREAAQKGRDGIKR